MLPRLQHLITVLPWQDWAALALFVFGWIGYARFAKQRAATILGRGANVSDITAALGFFLDSPAVTGQMIAVDGGQHLGWQTPDALDVE